MSDVKNILVPIDFSDLSENALEVAAQIAGRTGASLNVFHMLGLSEAVLAKDESQEYEEAQYYMRLANDRFRTFLDKPYLKGIPIAKTIQNYKIFTEINDLAKEQKIDLVVMGSHGLGAMRGLFVGSNTEKVVRSSEVPVLVIKKRDPDFKLEKVVYGIDYSVETASAYKRAMQFLAPWQPEIHLTHVTLPHLKFRSTKEVRQQAELFFSVAHHGDMPPNSKQIHLSDFSIEEGLYTYASEIDADLIVVATHGRKGLVHFFQGSIGKELVNHAELPVMTFKC
ncbi:universal stress protein [Poritiphilus flavus]|uniref:Universal stress protein n=1 Tax=Poritiphilus flavus TaxID=2697053 RepID=A0A6L9EBY1_9FLAO|nr:universal stress protein [Poritiphilus flavus]NAS11919.1 universal stress protein [Poritiphilus flavus]